MTTGIWSMLMQRDLTWWESVKCEVMNLVLTDEGFRHWADGQASQRDF